MDISIGQAIAIIGVWSAVGVIGFKNGTAAVILGFLAVLATGMITGAMK